MRRIRPWFVGTLCAVILAISAPAPLLAAPTPARGADAAAVATPIGWLHQLFDRLISWSELSPRSEQPARNDAPQTRPRGASAGPGGSNLTTLTTATTCDSATTEHGCAVDPDG